MAPGPRGRNDFTSDDDTYLVKYLAKYNPDKPGRTGYTIYKALEADELGRWKWSKQHTWQSWRERYKKRQDYFDARIKKYQKKKRISSNDGADSESAQAVSSSKDAKKRKMIEKDERKNKRRRREEEEPEEADWGVQVAHQLGDIEEQGAGVGDAEDRKADEDQGESKEKDQIEEDDDAGGLLHDDRDEAQAKQGNEELDGEDSQNVVDNEVQGTVDKQLLDGARHPMEISTPRTPPITEEKYLHPDITTPPSLPSTPLAEEDCKPSVAGTKEPSPLPVRQETIQVDVVKKPPSSASGHDSGIDMRSSPPRTAPSASIDADQLGKPKPNSKQRLGIPRDAPTRTDTLLLASPAPTLKSKSRQKRRAPSDSDFFVSSAGPSPPRSRTSVEREPPRLVQGAFGSTFTDAKGRAHVKGLLKEANFVDGKDGGVPVVVAYNKEEEEEEEAGTEEAEIPEITAKKPQAVNRPWPMRKRGDHPHIVSENKKEKSGTDNLPDRAIASKRDIKPKDRRALGVLPDHIAASSSELQQPAALEGHHPFSQLTQIDDFNLQLPEVKVSVSALAPEHHAFSQPTQMADLPTRSGNSVFSAVPGRFLEKKPGNFLNTASSSSSNPSRMFVQERLDLLSKKQPVVSKLHPHKSAPVKVVPVSRDEVNLSDVNVRSNGGMNFRSSNGSSSGEFFVKRTRKVFKFPPPRAPSVGSVSDPFIDRQRAFPTGHAQDKGKKKEIPDIDWRDRRQTFGGFPAASSTPQIDLFNGNNSLLPYHPRQPLPLDCQGHPSTRRSSVGGSGISATTTSSLAPGDQSLAMQLGLRMLIQRMSENHGFTEDVIYRVLDEVNSLEEADLFLRQMREGAEAAALELMEKRQSRRTRSESPEGPSRDHSTPNRSVAKEALQFTPASADDIRMRDYSPPENSRAGQFVRLLRQGRKAEAFERESRRIGDDGRIQKKAQAIEAIAQRSERSPQSVSDNGTEEPSPTVHLAPQLTIPPNLGTVQPLALTKSEDDILMSRDLEGIRKLEENASEYDFRRLRRRFVQLWEAQVA